MKKQFFLVLLLAVFSLILVENIKAQEGISTYSTVNYDAANNTVSGYSYTYATYANSGYYDTQVTSYIADSDDNVLDSGYSLGRLNASTLMAATGTGCGEYRIVSSHSTVVQYYATAYFYNNDYRDGYYDLFDYSQFSEQGQSYPLTASFFAPAVSTVSFLDYSEIILGSTEEISSGNCAPPTVQLTPPIEAVPKGGNTYVGVTVTGFNSKIPITLDLRRTSGTGEAKFVQSGSETATIPITSSTSTVEIKGITESSTKDNIQLGVKIGTKGALTSKDTFSVLWVTLSLQNTGSVAADNSGKQRQIQVVGTDNLGTFFNNTGIAPNRWRTCVQITGTVIPSNFTGTISLPRTIVASRLFVGGTLISSLNVDNQSDPQPDTQLVDFNPQPNGKIYDLDCPAISSGTSVPLGSILRVRTNFKQYAMYGTDRVSNDIEWFSRLSILKTSNDDVLSNDVTNDDVAGTGTTQLTWNLQP